MAVLNRSEIRPPVQRKEAVPVPALGGDVVVRQLTLSQLVEVKNDQRASFIVRLLSMSVVDGEGEAIFDVDQWDIWCAQNGGDGRPLIDKALQLNGLDLENRSKN